LIFGLDGAKPAHFLRIACAARKKRAFCGCAAVSAAALSRGNVFATGDRVQIWRPHPWLIASAGVLLGICAFTFRYAEGLS
jgi:hypothetical protein